MVGEQRNVLAPVAQRRDVDLDHVQPIIEIVAELALRDTSSARFLLVAAITRTSTLISCVPPTAV